MRCIASGRGIGESSTTATPGLGGGCRTLSGRHKSSPTTGPTFPISETSMTSPNRQQSMFSPEDSPARTTRLQETARDWLETVARSGGKCIGSLLSSAPPGLLERMSLGSSLVEAAQTLKRSSGRLPNSGMAWHGQFLTLNTSEWRNGAAVSSLSDILEDNPDPKYSLSAKACMGILNRAEQRGQELPPALRRALEAMAN